MRQEDAGGIAFDPGEIPKEETTLTIVATDADFKFGDSHKVKDANAQKIAVMVFNSLGIRREKWSNVSACRTIYTVTKGSPSVARGQFEHERPSVLTGAQMPEPNVREILRKADKLGQGVSALLKFSMVMFREGDTGPGGETGRREMISVEVGIKGEENDFRCLGRSGVMMADRDDPTFTVQVQPPGAFDIDHPQWKKVAATAVAKGLKPSFNGVLPNILHVMPGHAFGVSAHSQADSMHVFQAELPMGQELPRPGQGRLGQGSVTGLERSRGAHASGRRARVGPRQGGGRRAGRGAVVEAGDGGGQQQQRRRGAGE